MKKILLFTTLLLCTISITAQVANQPNDLISCAATNFSCDFDLTSQNAIILGAQDPSSYTISYYLTIADANTASGTVMPTGFCNTSNPQTIYARLEDNATGVFDVTSFDLIVAQQPVLVQVQGLQNCDDETPDGIATFDLTSTYTSITDGDSSLTLSYYASALDLNNNIPIANPTTYENVTSSVQTIFVLATNALGCTNTITFNLVVNPSPFLGYLANIIEACDNDMDGFSMVDLTQNIIPQPTVSYTFHESLADAEQDANPLMGNPTTISIADANSIGVVAIYVKAVDIFTNCSTIARQDVLIDCNSNNRITGNVVYDFDVDGCDLSDYEAGNLLVETTDGTNTYSTFTQTDGSYLLLTGTGTFTTTLVAPDLATSFTTAPASVTSNFTGLGNTDTANFCLTALNPTNDLTVSAYPLSTARPGFDTAYRIVYTNTGTTQLSGTVVFEYDDSKIQFLTASETTDATTSNSLTFNYTNLVSFETKTIDVNFNVFTPPTTNIDDVLGFTATINPVSGDATINNNTINYNQVVIGSYDPNDIQVVEGTKIPIDDADEYLHYIIRFQNTGTASAINVSVENILDDKLDWSSIQLENLSHEGHIEITNNNEVKFIFDAINLADSTSDEPNSHGFITYKIKPKNNVIIGDIIENSAAIYFDFNPPILTNTVATEIIDPLSVENFNTNTFTIYPNPSSDELYIRSKSIINDIVIFDLSGKRIHSFSIKDSVSKIRLDISELPQGFYFVAIQANGKKEIQKIIKK